MPPTATRRSISTRRAATRIVAGALVAAALLVGPGAAVAQAQTRCAPVNPLACLQIVQPPTAAPEPAPAPAPAPAAPPAQLVPAPVSPASAVVIPNAARRLIELVNGERSQAGLGQVTTREDITAIALEHSHRMAAAGTIFHNDGFFTTTVENLLGSLARGENVAQNTSVDDAHRRLMNSPGHRANILDGRFNTVGFAVVKTASGQYWVTQNFAQIPGGTRAPAAVAPAPTRASPKAPSAAPAARTVATTAPALAPAAAAEPAPVSVDIASETVAMVEAAPAPLPPAATTSAADAGGGGMGTSIAVLAIVLVSGALVGSWQLRRMISGLSHERLR